MMTFILGAGFSREQGFPLVYGLKERVIHFVEAERHPAHERFLVKDDNYERGEFYAGLEYIDPDANMGYEEVLIALSHHLGEKSEDPCFTTRDILRTGAARLLWCIDYFNPRPEGCYENFVDHLNAAPGGAAVITFNWDILLERALTAVDVRWSYSVAGDGSVAVIKPHGSLNWSSFRQNPSLVAEYPHWQPIRPGSTLSFDSADPLANTDRQDINSDLRYCLYPGDPDLPTSHPDIGLLWNDAVSAIRGSEKVVFIGYSLPEYDSFACEVFRNECAGKDIEVFDPSPSVDERFRAAFDGVSITRCTFSQSPYAQRRNAG
jgi:hypothetical protein